MGIEKIVVFIVIGLLLGYDQIKALAVKLKNKFVKQDKTIDDKEVENAEFSIVEAVTKFEDLKRCLNKGKKEEALEKLDEVFPLLNVEE